MVEPTGEFETWAEAVSAEPAVGTSIGAGAAVLLWDGAGLAPAWSTPNAAGFLAVLLDETGRVRADLPIAGRLAALAGGAAPLSGLRLDRVPFGAAGTITLASRRLRVGDAHLLYTAVLPPLPAVPAPPAAPAVHDGSASDGAAVADMSAGADGAAGGSSAPPDPVRPRRFVWSADPDGRFTAVSPALSAIVGPDAAAIAGRLWSEIAGEDAHDPDGLVAAALNDRRRWDGLSVVWRTSDGGATARVELSGMPVYGRGGVLAGFRGHGLCWPALGLGATPSIHDEATAHNDATAEPVRSAGDARPPVPVEASLDTLPADTLPAGARPPEAAAPREFDPVAAPPPGSTLSGRASPHMASERGGTRDAPFADVPDPATAAPDGSDGSDGVGSPGDHAATSDASAPFLDAPRSSPEEPTVQPHTEAPAEALSFVAEPTGDGPDVVDPEDALHEAARLDDAPLENASLDNARPEHARPEIAAGDEQAPVDAVHDDVAASTFLSRPIELPPSLALPTAVGQTFEATTGAAFGTIAARIPGELGAVRPAPLRVVDPNASVPAGPEPDGRSTGGALSTSERGALAEIARALGARMPDAEGPREEPGERRSSAEIVAMPLPRHRGQDLDRVLDRLPVGVAVLRGEAVLFANRHLLDLAGRPDLQAFAAAGGVGGLFGTDDPARHGGGPVRATIVDGAGRAVAVDARLAGIDWSDGPAALLTVVRHERSPEPRGAGDRRELDLQGALDLAGIGVVDVDAGLGVTAVDPLAARILGQDGAAIVGKPAIEGFAPASRRLLAALLDGLAHAGPGSVCDAVELVADGAGTGTRSILVRAGRGGVGGPYLRLVLQDLASARGREERLVAARRSAEEANLRQTAFLARVSHEIRTPVNAIVGFAELMMEERFGPIENERYRVYLGDIRSSALHVVSLVNDLLDLARVTSGKDETAFTEVDVGAQVGQAVALLQPAASRERIVVRTSLAAGLPPILADARSVRQIAINLVSNAIRFTPAGGQVIVSTLVLDGGAVGFRVRDTGIGMSPDDVAAALQPFRQVTPTRREDGTGLGLPLSKALTEANGGTLSITSRRNEGTLVEVTFPQKIAVS